MCAHRVMRHQSGPHKLQSRRGTGTGKPAGWTSILPRLPLLPRTAGSSSVCLGVISPLAISARPPDSGGKECCDLQLLEVVHWPHNPCPPSVATVHSGIRCRSIHASVHLQLVARRPVAMHEAARKKRMPAVSPLPHRLSSKRCNR